MDKCVRRRFTHQSVFLDIRKNDVDIKKCHWFLLRKWDWFIDITKSNSSYQQIEFLISEIEFLCQKSKDRPLDIQNRILGKKKSNYFLDIKISPMFYIKTKRKISDSVLWQKPLHPQTNPKSLVTKKKKTSTKTSIIQRMRTDLGRSVGETAVTLLVWFNQFTSAQPSHTPQK